MYINDKVVFGLMLYNFFFSLKALHQRRRMELEDKAKVVPSVWGAEFVKFLAALAVLHWSIRKERSNSSYFSKSTKAKQLAREGIEQILPPKQQRQP